MCSARPLFFSKQKKSYSAKHEINLVQMEVCGNWYAEEFGGGRKHELMNWKGFCACCGLLNVVVTIDINHSQEGVPH